MKGYGNLESARDLRKVVRLDDVRTNNGPVQVDAAILTTHDLNLRFVLAELLPGFLAEPERVPAGLGAGHRAFRGPMLDLPDVALVYAPEASVDIAVPWRPPSAVMCPYRGSRRQHAKIAAILFRVDNERRLRLIASSANLTRRGFAANLEAAAFEDYAIGPKAPKYPSLFQLRRLLEALRVDSTLAASRAYESFLAVLPESAGKKTSQQIHFVHSVEPNEYRHEIGTWLRSAPELAAEFVRSLVVSPFFSAQGSKLREFALEDLRWGRQLAGPIDLVLDGRQRGDESKLDSGAFSTPPAWLRDARHGDSSTYRPALINRSRSEELKGSSKAGRPLHAKILGAAWRRKRTSRHVWRLLVGSSNFSESGLGLAGDSSSVEAGFLIEHEEVKDSDVLGPITQTSQALCVGFELAPAPAEREGQDLKVELGVNRAGKQALEQLDANKPKILRRADGRFEITVWFATIPDGPFTLRCGKVPFMPTSTPGEFQIVVDSLAPYFIAVEIGQRSFSWPLPMTEETVRAELISAAGSRRRMDRLLEFWLAESRTEQAPDDDDDDAEGLMGSSSVSPTEIEPSPGSWRLNRLMLGLRRRLAESVHGVRPRLPSARALMGSVRVQELLVLAAELPEPDKVYFGTMVRAALLGYVASEEKCLDWANLSNPAKAQPTWSDQAWVVFESSMAVCRKQFDRAALNALDAAAMVVFDSVREGAIVE